jgi:hypothetical protein
MRIEPGRENIAPMSVTFREEIKPGDYTLKATRNFSSSGGDFTVESNSIKVKVMK